MAKHPTSSRVPRQTDSEDAFIARVLEYSAWARRHSRAVIAAAVLIFLVVGGALYYRSYQQNLRSQAEAQLAEIRRTAAMGNVALAVRDLETFVETFSRTPSASEGRLMLGELHLIEGNHEGALDAVRPLAERRRDPLSVPAGFLEAAALEDTGRLAEAERAYLRIAENADMDFQRRRALAGAARLRMDRGDASGAADLYRRLLTITPDGDPQQAIVRMRLAEAETRAAAAGGEG